MTDRPWIRVSSLEKFRLCCLEDSYVTPEELETYIRAGQQGEASERMRIGTAWHKVLEHPFHGYKAPEGDGPALNLVDGFTFWADEVTKARAMVGLGRREVEYVKLVETRGGELMVLKGTIDLLHGMRVTDYKVKVASTPDAADYEKSLQWRAYLWLTGAREFRYFLFPCKEPDSSGFVELYAERAVPFSFFRYEALQSDVVRWCSEFHDWAKAKDLLKYCVPMSNNS